MAFDGLLPVRVTVIVVCERAVFLAYVLFHFLYSSLILRALIIATIMTRPPYSLNKITYLNFTLPYFLVMLPLLRKHLAFANIDFPTGQLLPNVKFAERLCANQLID